MTCSLAGPFQNALREMDWKYMIPMILWSTGSVSTWMGNKKRLRMPTRVRRLQQPYDKGWCGQVVVAMLGGISVAAALDLVGTRGPTHAGHLVKALHKLGYQCQDKLIRITKKEGIPRTCIVRWQISKKPYLSHWLLYLGGIRYDPNSDGKCDWLLAGHPTSYLAIDV